MSEISYLNNLVQLIISQCWQLELDLHLEDMNSLQSITFDGCGKLESFLLNKCQNVKRVSGNFDVESIFIFDCPELEELVICDCTGLRCLELVGCGKLQAITLPTTLINFTVQRCPEVEELPNLGRLSCLKSISIDSCEKLENIAGIEELQALEAMQLLFCSNPAIQGCIRKLTSVPSAFIQVVGKAAGGAKSNLNPSLLSEAIFCADAATLCRTLDHLERSVSAIILCSVVKDSDCALIPTINKKYCEWKFSTRPGEWIITTVITDLCYMELYLEELWVAWQLEMDAWCAWAVKKGEDSRTLHALTTIIDRLHL